MTGSAPFGVDAAVVDPGTTDERGVARFRLPSDSPFRGALALKEGVGFDYVANPVVAAPEAVPLTLQSGRTITLRARDSAGRPVPGIAFRLDGINFGLRPPGLSGALRITRVTTDASGLARWGWFREKSSGDVRVLPPEDLVEEATPRLSFLSEGDVTLNVLIRRKARLSGRVVNADGSPARGVTLTAIGMGQPGGDARLMARTEADGSYAMAVRPGRSYLIAVTSPGHASLPISDISVGEGESHGGLNFLLMEGTRLHGRATVPPGGSRYVLIYLLGEELPPAFQEKDGPKARFRLPISVPLDAQGDYEVRLGPGDYEVMAPGHREHPTIHVDGGGEFLLNFLGDPAAVPRVALTGVVVEPAPDGGERPAKASVTVTAVDSGTSRATTDEAGRFTVQRPDQDVVLYAQNLNGVAAVRVTKGTKEVKVVLGPLATASGRVVDARGKPIVGEGPRMIMTTGPEDLPRDHSVVRLSKLDPGGRYEFKVLVPGAEYRLSFLFTRDSGVQENLPIKTFRVERPGPIDLGEFVVPDEKPANEGGPR